MTIFARGKQKIIDLFRGSKINLSPFWGSAKVWIEGDVILEIHLEGRLELPLSQIERATLSEFMYWIWTADDLFVFPSAVVIEKAEFNHRLHDAFEAHENRHSKAEDIPLKYRCMTLRWLLEEPVAMLADPVRQRQVWLDPFKYGSLDDVLEQILDDCNFGSEETDGLYLIQSNRAMDDCEILGAKLYKLSKSLGDVTPKAYLEHPDWPEIVESAAKAKASLLAEEQMPDASEIAPITDWEKRTAIEAAFARWRELPIAELVPTKDERELFLSLGINVGRHDLRPSSGSLRRMAGAARS